MLKMGLPAGAVKNALQRDGKDPSVIDLDPEKSLKSQKDSPVEEKDDGPPLCEDPQFTKVCGVGHMKSSIVQLFCSLTLFVANAILNTQYFKVRMSLSHESLMPGYYSCHLPTFIVFQMLKMGLPLDAVKNALQRDGKDPTVSSCRGHACPKSSVVYGSTRIDFDTKRRPFFPRSWTLTITNL